MCVSTSGTCLGRSILHCINTSGSLDAAVSSFGDNETVPGTVYMLCLYMYLYMYTCINKYFELNLNLNNVCAWNQIIIYHLTGSAG